MDNKWRTIDWEKIEKVCRIINEWYNEISHAYDRLFETASCWEDLVKSNLPKEEKEFWVYVKDDRKWQDGYYVASYDDTNSSPCFWMNSDTIYPVAWMEIEEYRQ